MHVPASRAPRIAVGLPLYNGEKYLEATLRSLLAQSWSDFTLIVSDNASTDRGPEICREYAATDPRIVYVRNDGNIGAARNFNRTFDLCRSEYFKWAAYDDLCAPGFLERCVAVLDHEPDVVLAYPRTVTIDAEGALLGPGASYRDGCHLVAAEPHRRLREFFEIGNLCHPVFGLIRSDVLKRTGRIRSCLSSDRILLGELALHGKLFEIDEGLAFRRMHGENSIAANPGKQQLLAWFDPQARDRLPFFRIKVEYFRMIRHAPLPAGERLRCYAEVGKFLLGGVRRKLLPRPRPSAARRCANG